MTTTLGAVGAGIAPGAVVTITSTNADGEAFTTTSTIGSTINTQLGTAGPNGGGGVGVVPALVTTTGEDGATITTTVPSLMTMTGTETATMTGTETATVTGTETMTETDTENGGAAGGMLLTTTDSAGSAITTMLPSSMTVSPSLAPHSAVSRPANPPPPPPPPPFSHSLPTLLPAFAR